MTQQELGDKISVSRRVIAYYEGETQYPPAHLLVPLADALGVSTDDLLDTKRETADIDDNLAKIFRKLKVVSTFSDKDKKAVFHFVQTIEEKNKVQRKTSHPAK